MPFPSDVPINNATVPDIAPWAQATNTDDVPKLLTPRPPQILEHTLATGLTTNVFAAQRADWRSRTTVFTGTGTGSRIFNIGSGAFQDGDWLELRRNSTGAVSLMLLAGQTFSDGTTVRALRENETIRIIRSGTIWYYTTDSGGAVSADRLPPLRQRFAFYQNSNRTTTTLPPGTLVPRRTGVQRLNVDGSGTFDGRSTNDQWGTDTPIWDVVNNRINIDQILENEALLITVTISNLATNFLANPFTWKPSYVDSNLNIIGSPDCYMFTSFSGSLAYSINIINVPPENAEWMIIEYVSRNGVIDFFVENILIVGGFNYG